MTTRRSSGSIGTEALRGVRHRRDAHGDVTRTRAQPAPRSRRWRTALAPAKCVWRAGNRNPVPLVVTVTALTVAFGCGCGEPASRNEEPAASARTSRVGAGEPILESLPRNSGHVGVVVRERRVVVPAPFDARMLERFVQPGDEVEAGQPLARFDSETVDRALAIARAAVTEADAALQVAQVEASQSRVRYARREGNRELFSAEQLEEMAAEVEVARARVESADARLMAARTAALEARAAAERATLRAPLAGVVDEVYGSPGIYDTRGAPVVAIEAGDWHVRFAAPPEASTGFSRGSPLTVMPEHHDPVRGFVIYASPELDPRTLLFTFEGLLCSDDLPAGTPVRVLPVPRPADGERPLGCPQTPGS